MITDKEKVDYQRIPQDSNDVTKKDILCDVIKKDLLGDEGYKSMSSNSSASVVSTTTSISPDVRDPPESQPEMLESSSLFRHHNDRL